MMSTIGSWPQQRCRNILYYAHSMLNILLILTSITLPILGIGYIWQHWHTLTFFDMGHNILCTLLGCYVLARLIVARSAKYYDMMRDYLFEFHLFYYKDQSEYNAKIYKVIHIISGMLTLYIEAQMALGIILFNLSPLYNNYKHGMFSDHPPANRTLEQAVYYYSPNNYPYSDMNGYWILFICNIPVTCYVTCGVCAFDLVVSTIVLQILGHLQILKHNLLAVPLPMDAKSSGMYSVEENVQIQQFLKNNIMYHRFIVKFAEKCSNALSEYLFMF
uniref:Odorant receptors OR4.2 n=1 Tax=Lobesia botrana TaxID=209534 RepID=A0A345BEU0_9NEOP|nr:odorant receptors OR4.2 [Lobesia botrana]